MTRNELVFDIAQRYGVFLSAVSRIAADSAGNLASVIDDALRALGYAEDELATAAPTDIEEVNDLRAMAAYHTMAQVVRDLSIKSIDIGTAGDSFKLSQRIAAAKEELKRAEAAVLARDLSPTPVPADATGIVTWDLNFLTPRWPAVVVN